MPYERYSHDRIIEALTKSAGVLVMAAHDLGCDRRTVQRYLDRHPELREARAIIDETSLDVAEAQLFRLIEAGDGPMIRFFLQTKGRGRGYTKAIDVQLPAIDPAYDERNRQEEAAFGELTSDEALTVEVLIEQARSAGATRQ